MKIELNLNPDLNYYYLHTSTEEGGNVVYIWPEDKAKNLFSNFNNSWKIYQKSSKDPDQLELFTEEQLNGD
jgi:hypothetical protein